MIAMIAPN